MVTSEKCINKVIYENNSKILIYKSRFFSELCIIEYISKVYERISYALKKYHITLPADHRLPINQAIKSGSQKYIYRINEHGKPGMYTILFKCKS